MVKEPTRGEYLLDLALSDLVGVTASALPYISDHRCVLVECTFKVDVLPSRARSVWNFRSADWSAMSEHVASLDFSFINQESVDSATEKLTQMLLVVCDTFVSKRIIFERGSSHPWISERCREALAAKHAAQGTTDYGAKCLAFTNVLREDFTNYVTAVKTRLFRLRSGSKEFWKLSKKLLLGSDKADAIPSLKDTAGVWKRTPIEKANLFAESFRAKWNLPCEVNNFYSCQLVNTSRSHCNFLQVRSRNALFFLASLDCASSTGPDGLSTIFLRNLADVLCFPFARLARRILVTGRWPSLWKHHWICPVPSISGRLVVRLPITVGCNLLAN